MSILNAKPVAAGAISCLNQKTTKDRGGLLSVSCVGEKVEVEVKVKMEEKRLKAVEVTPDTFKEYGQVIEPTPDGDQFGPDDAQLDLSGGIPRFYIVHLESQPPKFSNITHHASVTQCLGSIGGHVWYLGVAKPSIASESEAKDDKSKNILRSKCGHFYMPPAIDDVRVFRISGSKFIKLNRGTWHAGPLFKVEAMDFYNLELSNTNVVDHTLHDFKKKDKVVFIIDE